MRERRGAVLRQEGKQSPLFLRTKALVMEDSAGVTLLSTMQYCSVARNKRASSVPMNTGPSVEEGLK